MDTVTSVRFPCGGRSVWASRGMARQRTNQAAPATPAARGIATGPRR